MGLPRYCRLLRLSIDRVRCPPCRTSIYTPPPSPSPSRLSFPSAEHVRLPWREPRRSVLFVLVVVVHLWIPATSSRSAISLLRSSFRRVAGVGIFRDGCVCVCTDWMDRHACKHGEGGPGGRRLTIASCPRRPRGRAWCGCSGRGTRRAPPAGACGSSAPSAPSTGSKR